MSTIPKEVLPFPARNGLAPRISHAPLMGLNAEENCRECGSGNIIEDHASGDMICRDCGLVAEDRVVDVHSEWRTFSSESSGPDPSRVGGASNPLLSDAGLSTVISRSEAHSGLSKSQSRLALGSDDRNLIDAFKDISEMAGQMSLPQSITDVAHRVFQAVGEKKSLRGRSTADMVAACVYWACRQEGVPRTFKEICALTQASKTDIGKAFKFICKTLDANMKTITTGDFLNRFCSNLDLPISVVNAATAVAEEAVKLGIIAGKSPISVAAAAIYMVTQLHSQQRRSQKDIAAAAGVAEVTIRHSYKDMYPERHKLIPANFAPIDEINRLPSS